MIVLALIIGLVGVGAAIHIAAPLAGVGRAWALAATAVVALGALGAYAVGAAPGQPGDSYADRAARLQNADPASLSVTEQEERLRVILRQDPEAVQAMALLGRLLARTDRSLEAIAVFERALRIEEDPRILSDLGQAFVNLNEGRVSEQAREAFAAAHAADPALPEAAFFLGAAAYQEGDRETAAQRWGEIVARLPEGDPFRTAIAARAADLLSRPAGGPGEGGEAPFAAMAEDGADPDAMIAAMVARLAGRLEEDPEDFAGWLTLARARAMLGEADAAAAALAAARTRFGGEPGRAAMIAALSGALEIEESDA
ncbi:hypothetical protein DDZ18_10020 [Marinicauda salina]|uniref:Cytochrome c-type biogenesis protein H TPR domain-containing protein n=1 Tax=Marinicauda salina TaxID=2135793 RepID=A0A2U2BSQ9_9PROT|nr:tetratricopeptide repeat protein [Marinicauda salina]PWE17031.1 hypothetical protein DDZ18_10020 [Marinicauda salina]